MLLPVLLFAVVFASLMLSVGLGFAYFKTKQKNQIRSMLRKAEATPAEQRSSAILRAAEEETVLGNFLERFQFTSKIDLFLEQASQDWTASKLITLTAGATVVGLVVGLKLSLFGTYWSSVGTALFLGAMPFLMVWRKRSKAISQFEEQLPEALDFLSRSMRAGHGFSVALEMLAADSPDPLGGAFRKVSNEIHLGSALDVALGKLVQQVPIVDVRFFVSSVVLQQETGGNLGEILSKLADIIRERFRLRGSVKAAAAHGKVTGMVLVLMPVAVTILLMIGNPSYLTNMMSNPLGRYMVYAACAGQVVGYFVIRKIVDIKV
jgi:tight adherence protein B